tara:strand:+ start:413 stop:532 length:120 start_codon:yes stop_codon:yes gene_type:complete
MNKTSINAAYIIIRRLKHICKKLALVDLKSKEVINAFLK